jgi:hypothetical protein
VVPEGHALLVGLSWHQGEQVDEPEGPKQPMPATQSESKVQLAPCAAVPGLAQSDENVPLEGSTARHVCPPVHEFGARTHTLAPPLLPPLPVGTLVPLLPLPVGTPVPLLLPLPVGTLVLESRSSDPASPDE